MGLLRASFLCIGVTLLGVSVASAAEQLPVQITYSSKNDLACSSRDGSEIPESWKHELEARRAEFDALWGRLGPKLIKDTIAIVGKPFPAGIVARLTLCNVPSESFPAFGVVSVNMRFALKSFTDRPVSMQYKVGTLFHELLHVYLDANPVANSALSKAHALEDRRVLNHLHLLALQKAVYLRLGLLNELEEQVRIDSSLPGGYYKRAWALVNATDNEYIKYISEINSD